jgi:hypothetical protein
LLKYAFILLLPLAAAAFPATASARMLEWSGHSWEVRSSGFGTPGPNQWSDSPENVRVEGSELVLSIARDALGRWTSAEVANRAHLGYGTYRWVVNSDLSALDASEVLGMFTYGGTAPSNNEIDFEPSHWGNTAWPSGSATVWQDAAGGRRQTRSFHYTDRPPYTHELVWRPGAIDLRVTDGAGTRLLDWPVRQGVPVPSSEVPMINYWRDRGVPPASVRTMRLASFSWTPQVELRPARVVVAAGASATVRTSATHTSVVHLDVQRTRGGRSVTVGTLRRTVRAGSDRIRLAGLHLPPGRYQVTLRAAAPDVRLIPKRLRLTVRGS